MRRILLGLVTWLWASAAMANVPCTLPFNLQNNTVADATQVMANYNAIVTCLGNAAAAGANSDITSLLGLTTPIPYTAGGSSVYIGGTSGGTANAQTVASPTPLGFSLTTGKTIIFIAGATNTGATQLNVNSLGLTDVYRMSPSGPQALTGGEIVTNNLTFATYDGTRFQLLSTQSQFGGYGPSTSIASATTTDLGTAASHNVTISGVTTITSFGSSASTTYPAYRLNFAGAMLLTYDATALILPGLANITTAINDSAEAVYLGSGNWKIAKYQRANGTAVVNPTPLCGFSGLSIANNAGTPNTNIDYVAASAVLINPTGNVPIYVTSVSGTINTTNGTGTSAVDGMDGEARPTSAWGYVYIISNGTTTGGLVSTSATAPTMPAGYTSKCLAGAMRYDGSQNQMRTKQLGADTQYVVVSATNTANMPRMANGSSGNPATPTWTAVATGTYVPPIATRIRISLSDGAAGDTVMAAPNNSYGAFNSSTNAPPMVMSLGTGAGQHVIAGDFMLESTNIYWASNDANGAVWCLGWKNAVNAN